MSGTTMTVPVDDAIPVANLQHVAADARRAREFYKYLQPSNLLPPRPRRRESTFSTFDAQYEHVPSLSAALVPYCQLTALRCNVRKAMLNLMDRDMMYFLAEASRVPKMSGDQEFYEFVEDPILVQCSSIPLTGRICEMTIRMEKDEDSRQTPMFIIRDLRESQFSEMEIVTKNPGYRFYAGTPITTRDGINIGSLAIMDTTSRPDGLSASEEEFLGETAAQIMTYLETNRQAIEGRRSRRMAECLESFIAGRRSVDEAIQTTKTDHLKKRSKTVYGMSLPSEGNGESFQRTSPRQKGTRGSRGRGTSLDSLGGSEFSTSEQSTDNEIHSPRDELDTESRSHSKTFARAANLLREAFGDLGEDGSVVFLNTKGRLDQTARKTSPNGQKSPSPDRPATPRNTQPLPNAISPIGQEACVLASSTTNTPFGCEDNSGTVATSLGSDMLIELMARYPAGRLWTLDGGSRSSSSEEDAEKDSAERRRRRSRRKINEENGVKAAFPNARQVLFVPVWDANTGSFAYAVFVAASLEIRSLSSTGDLSFLNAFCSTVMAECSRLDTMKADKQKSDFVGTISHEMRSPLHGILASVEFLAETELSGFQRSLIDTVDSCGRTLLDTINHVLDFSKVNSFQKHWQASNRRNGHLSKKKHYLGPESTSKTFSHGAPPLLQLFAVTDVSAVLEEVVDGLVLGHLYTSGIDITDVSREARGKASKDHHHHHKKLLADEVQVFLDVQQADWTFVTQPGAVRRVVMNIVGNALKYTPPTGSIHVSLELKSPTTVADDKDSQLVILTVKDTGRGISPDFLSTKLFVPFAQENALAPGTGLGLSIVNSIITMLGGTIDIKSTLGKGTIVQVALPLKRPLPGQTSTMTTPHSGGTVGSGSVNPDESITVLQHQGVDCRVALYRPGRDITQDSLAKSIGPYIGNWYGLQLVGQQLIGSATVVITEEEDLESLIGEVVGTPGNRPALIVLCGVASKHSVTYVSSIENRINGAVELLAKPCGPYKLAKSLKLVLEKRNALQPHSNQIKPLATIPERSPYPFQRSDSRPENITDDLQQMDISSPGQHSGSRIVQASETFAASQTSQHAQMAINSPGQLVRSPYGRNEGDSFPFPNVGQQSADQVTNKSNGVDELPTSTQNLRSGSIFRESDTIEDIKIDPRILLVDDNKINLKLLETFLKTKRKYSRVDKAENGKLAVDAVSNTTEPYEIIFMDISMPVMNGFEATRCIREFETQNNIKTGAMVIALTGLASARDQSEGFDSGCDIYMTKPVSFKEVGALLDNWEAHQKLKDSNEDESTDHEQGNQD